MTFSNKDKSITKEEAWNKASFLCASSEKCLYDIQEKLKSWGCNSDDSEQICQRLIEEQYIDQTRYAYFYVKDKFRFNKWGKIKIKIMLASKKIEPSVIEEALQIIDESEYEELLNSIISTKLKSLKFKDSYDKENKLLRFALSRPHC